MSKMISFCGSPNSGVTTASLKFAQELYNHHKCSVVYLSPDMSVPSMAYLFPNGKDSEIYSLGVTLDKTDIYKEDVIRQFVCVKTMSDFSFLGFKFGENKYSYPRPTEDKIVQLFSALRETVDYVVVDCSHYEDDLISAIAKRDCDMAFQFFNPDFKCLTYYTSCVNQFLSVQEKKKKVLNLMDADTYLPIDETKSYFGGMDYILPYSVQIKQQMITGTLSERIRDKGYQSMIQDMVKAVV